MDRIKFLIEESEIQGLSDDIRQKMYEDYCKKKNPGLNPVMRCVYSQYGVVVDVCVPKFLFGNSLEETTDTNLAQFVQSIQQYASKTYGLVLSVAAIKEAKCWYLEYGKNIVLPAKYNQMLLLQKIGRCLVHGSQQLTSVKYVSSQGNHGCKVGIYTQSYEQCFYDKTTKEMFAGAKGDKALFAALLKDDKLQVMRFEVKFFRQASIRSALKHLKCGISSFTVEDVWDSQLEKRYLLGCWDKIKPTISTCRISTDCLEKAIYSAIQKGICLKDILYLMGLFTLKQRLGATQCKHLLCPTLTGKQKQRNRNQYAMVKKKQCMLNKFFQTKKEYIVQRISSVLTDFIAIRKVGSNWVGI